MLPVPTKTRSKVRRVGTSDFFGKANLLSFILSRYTVHVLLQLALYKFINHLVATIPRVPVRSEICYIFGLVVVKNIPAIKS